MNMGPIWAAESQAAQEVSTLLESKSGMLSYMFIMEIANGFQPRGLFHVAQRVQLFGKLGGAYGMRHCLISMQAFSSLDIQA